MALYMGGVPVNDNTQPFFVMLKGDQLLLGL